MHIVTYMIGEKMVASTDTVLTVLAVKDGAVLLGIESIHALSPREEDTAISAIRAAKPKTIDS